MANYQQSQTTQTVTSWTRARQVVADNPIDGPPSVTVHTAVATTVGEQTIERAGPDLRYTLGDPTVPIPLVDPETYEPTEQTITTGFVWLVLASVFLWLDRQQQEPPA